MKTGVTQILLDAHGLSASPAGKIECPFCHHKTFSIKKDDTIGKCFHPNCLQFITLKDESQGINLQIYQVLELLFDDFHRTLLAQADHSGRNPHAYSEQERKIHPQVIADSMLGAVPPDCDIEEPFGRLIKDIETKIETEKQATKGKRGRPKTARIESLSSQMEIVRDVRDKLNTCIKACPGWL